MASPEYNKVKWSKLEPVLVALLFKDWKTKMVLCYEDLNLFPEATFCVSLLAMGIIKKAAR